MGSGRWSATTYTESTTAKAMAGKDVFDYSSAAAKTGQWRVHQTLDPRGLGMRESRDGAEHPESNAIIISLDVTGSMGKVVRGIHKDLPRLHEMLLGHKYIPHPQILFGAVSDATCDSVPLQVGQFESDNRMDQNLENMLLEGGGGRQKTESYELMLYVAARHTATDCWEKRKHKGYLFIIGDEMAYSAVSEAEVKRLIGGGLQADLPLDQAIADVSERYHLYFVIPGGASHGSDQEILDFWERHLGPQRVLHLETPEETSECIALTIGMNEGAITSGDGADHLRQRGVVARTIDSVMRAFSSRPATDAPADAPRTRRL